MQPKFTLRSLGYCCTKIFATALIFVALCNAAYSQETEKSKSAASEKNLKPSTTNDAGVPDEVTMASVAANTPIPDIVCSTINGALAATDGVIPGGRFFRDGVASGCAAPKTTCPGFFANGDNNYDSYTWTNPLCVTQCLTITVVTPGVNAAFCQAYLGPFVPADVCANYLGDAGSSTATMNYAVNVPAGATVTVVVTTVVPGTFNTYQLILNANIGCVAAGPCVGTPSPGNTIASTAIACVSNSISLSLQNCTPGTGVTYQWQTAPASTGPWTNAGPNSPVWSRNQAVATWYRCQVTCSGNTGTSTPVFVDQNPFYNCYCNSNATSNADEDIFNVTIGTLNNSSNCATTAPGPGSVNRRYSNYKTLTPGNIVTGNMPISVEVGTCGGNFTNSVAVWIDYNQNGVFETPAERAYVSPAGAPGPHIENGIAAIPTTALSGVTGMRVVNVETGAPLSITPCGTYTWGETEDYLVNISPCVPLLGVTAPASVTAECSGIAAIPANTGSASFPSFTWEYRINASSPWQVAANGGLGGVITGANTGSLVLINVPNTLNGYQFRAIVSNPCSAIDVSAPITTLSVVPLVARVSPTSATICNNGTIQQLSLQSPQATFCSGTVNINVPDGNPNGVIASIPVSGIPGAATITEVRVTFNMTHTYAGDMSINLKAPNGQTINLFALLDNGTGSNGSPDFVNTSISSDNSRPPLSGAPAPRTGVFRADRYGTVLNAPPFGPLVTPVTTQNWALLTPTGASANGTWTLGMADLGAIDLGVLQNWCITISYGSPVTGIWTSNPALPNTMFTDAGATIAYTGTPVSTIYVRPTANTSYTVTASTVSPSCTSAPVTIPVNVTQPLVNVVNPVNKTVCAGGTTTFSVVATSAPLAPYNGPFTYQWQETRNNGITWNNVSNGGNYSGATSANLVLTGVTRAAPLDMNNFRYRCIVSAPPCAGTTTTTDATLTVLALPAVTISATDLALTPGSISTLTGTSNPAPLNATSWSWTRDGAPIAGATGNSVVADIDKLGVYRATVTDVNGCTNSSNSILIESEVSDKLWIYPNPTTGLVQVRLYYSGVYTERRRLQIFDQNGQEVMSRDMTLSNTTPHYLRMDVDLGMQPAGIYVVKVTDLYTRKATSGLIIKQSK